MRAAIGLLSTLLLLLAGAARAATEPARLWDVAEASTRFATDAAGNVYLLGGHRTSTKNGEFTLAIHRCVVIRKRAADSAAQLWSREFCGDYTVDPDIGSTIPLEFDDIAFNAQGEMLFAAWIGTVRTAARLDPATGASLWESTATQEGYRFATADMAVGANGDLWLRSMEGGALRVVRLRHEDGTTAFATAVGPVHNFQSGDIAVDANGFAVLTYRGLQPAEEPRLVRVDGGGNIAWDLALSGFPGKLALDPQGNPVMQEGAATMVKRLAASGGVAWQRTVAGDAGAYAVAPDGSLVLSIRGSDPATSQFTRVVERWASGDGSTLWSHRFFNSGTRENAPANIFFDASGNPLVVLAHFAPGFAGEDDPNSVAELALATGQQLWELPLYESGWRVILTDLELAPGGFVAAYGNGTSVNNLVRVVKRELPLQGRARRFDMDADGFADLLWLRDDGASAAWFMAGPLPDGGARLLGPGSGWFPRAMADFDGDGFADVYWQHADGASALWLMRGGTQVGGGRLLAGGLGWTMRALADFNGDGKADILWQHADGSVAIWTMDGSRQAGGARLIGAGTGWSVRQVADFNGDGRADIAWQHEDGRAAIWLMDGAAQSGGALIVQGGSGLTMTDVGDFNGDGRADIVWRANDGSVVVWLMDGTTMLASASLPRPAFNGFIVATGDFDGDGRDDLVWSSPAGGLWLSTMSGVTATRTILVQHDGETGPVFKARADYDGDGVLDFVTEDANGDVRVWFLAGGSLVRNELLQPGTGWHPVAIR